MKKFFMKLSDSGMGMIEILIASTLLAGISYVVVKERQAYNRALDESKFSSELSSVQGYFENILADPAKCISTTKNTVPGKFIAGEPVGGHLYYFYTKPDDHQSTLRSGSIVLAGVELAQLRLINDGSKDFIRATFTVGEKFFGSLGGKSVNKDFPLVGKKDGTQRFTECALELPPERQQLLCSSMNGEWVNGKCETAKYYRKSADLVKLYDDGAGGFTTTPAGGSNVYCTCPQPRVASCINQCKDAIPTSCLSNCWSGSPTSSCASYCQAYASCKITCQPLKVCDPNCCQIPACTQGQISTPVFTVDDYGCSYTAICSTAEPVGAFLKQPPSQTP